MPPVGRSQSLAHATEMIPLFLDDHQHGGINQKDDGGAQAMLLRSEDGGVSWRSLCDPAQSPSAANIHGLAPDFERSGGVVIGTDTGEGWRVSNDSEWELLGSSLPEVLSIITF